MQAMSRFLPITDFRFRHRAFQEEPRAHAAHFHLLIFWFPILPCTCGPCDGRRDRIYAVGWWVAVGYIFMYKHWGASHPSAPWPSDERRELIHTVSSCLGFVCVSIWFYRVDCYARVPSVVRWVVELIYVVGGLVCVLKNPCCVLIRRC